MPLKLMDSNLERYREDNFYSLTVVKFNSISFSPYILRRQFTEIDFIAYTGGAFGLFLGVSILSFVEIAYYSSIRILFNWIRRRRVVKVATENMVLTENKKMNYLSFFFKISTIHGMGQIVMQHRSFVERFEIIFKLLFILLYSQDCFDWLMPTKLRLKCF